MIKKYILIILAIALAVSIGFFFGKKAAEAPISGTTEVAQ